MQCQGCRVALTAETANDHKTIMCTAALVVRPPEKNPALPIPSQHRSHELTSAPSSHVSSAVALKFAGGTPALEYHTLHHVLSGWWRAQSAGPVCREATGNRTRRNAAEIARRRPRRASPRSSPAGRKTTSRSDSCTHGASSVRVRFSATTHTRLCVTAATPSADASKRNEKQRSDRFQKQRVGGAANKLIGL